MTPVAHMSAEELAALVCDSLASAGIAMTLTGGACVSIWSDGRYVSRDLDFVEDEPVPRQRIAAALARLGFVERGRHFAHPETHFFVEFPPGPLMVGNEPITSVAERTTATGRLRLLSPTDCVRDRLAAFYHWNDRSALEQALLVACAQPIDLVKVRRWSAAEDKREQCAAFEARLAGRGG